MAIPTHVKKVFESIDQHTGEKNTAGENMNHPGEYYISEKKGLTKKEVHDKIEGLKKIYAPKWYHKIFRIDPREKKECKELITKIQRKRYLWPAVDTLCINCPFCNCAFASTEDHIVTETDDESHTKDILTVTPKLVCPQARSHAFEIYNGKIKIIENNE